MKKCLYVDCCIRREESKTAELANAFFEELKGYEVKHLILENENLKPLIGDFFFERQELLERDERNHPRFNYAHEFANADMVVIAAPFWDLCFPALLKIYIENVSVDGITFASTENGLVGTCKGENLIYFTTRGGFYEGEGSLDVAIPHLRSFVPFFGFKKFQYVAADGINVQGFDGVKSLEDAKQKAKELAKTL